MLRNTRKLLRRELKHVSRSGGGGCESSRTLAPSLLLFRCFLFGRAISVFSERFFNRLRPENSENSDNSENLENLENPDNSDNSETRESGKFFEFSELAGELTGLTNRRYHECHTRVTSSLRRFHADFAVTKHEDTFRLDQQTLLAEELYWPCRHRIVKP